LSDKILKSTRKYLARWNTLSRNKKTAFIKSAICLLVIKTGLELLPFSTFRKIFHWFSKSGNKSVMSQHKINEVVWAVESAANHLPFELLCLPRALATKYLLRELPALTLEIGIQINSSKVFEAHAWVEQNGVILIGDWSDSASYQRLWAWE
jgi:uncharacterized membrane protein YbjE (DUF340 family)